MTDETTNTAALAETAEPSATPVAEEPKPKKAKALPPLDLNRALRPTNAGVRSTNVNPAWDGPPYLLGRIVAYVQDDGADTEAKVLQLGADGQAVLLVSVGTQGVDDLYQRQMIAPLGRPGEAGTWHEVDDG